MVRRCAAEASHSPAPVAASESRIWPLPRGSPPPQRDACDSAAPAAAQRPPAALRPRQAGAGTAHASAQRPPVRAAASLPFAILRRRDPFRLSDEGRSLVSTNVEKHERCVSLITRSRTEKLQAINFGRSFISSTRYHVHRFFA